MNPNNFDDLLTFAASPAGQHFHLPRDIFQHLPDDLAQTPTICMEIQWRQRVKM